MKSLNNRFFSLYQSTSLADSCLQTKIDDQFQDLRLRDKLSTEEPKVSLSPQHNNIICNSFLNSDKKIIRKLFDTPTKKTNQKQRTSLIVEQNQNINLSETQSKLKKSYRGSIRELRMVGYNLKSFPSEKFCNTQKYEILNKKKKLLMIEQTPYVSNLMSMKYKEGTLYAISTQLKRNKSVAPFGSKEQKQRRREKERLSQKTVDKHRMILSKTQLQQIKEKKQIRKILSNQSTEPMQELGRQQKYKEFIFLINYSNKIYRNLDDVIYEKPVLYYLGKGNNHKLIKQIMKKRFWWKQTKEMEHAHFIWTQNRVPQLFNKQPTRKHLDQMPAIQFSSQKQTIKIEVKQRLSNILTRSQANSYEIMLNKQMKYKKQVTFQWKSRTLKLKRIQSPLVVHNHLPNNNVIGNKKSLLFCISEYSRITGLKLLIPLTFHIKQFEDQQYLKFNDKFKQNREQGKNNIWIIKPGESSNRGSGIICCSKLQQINKILTSKSQNRTYIVQQYISKPLLYNRRKFDIRVYLLITIVNSKLKAYWYKIGYIRTSSKIFSLDNLQDTSVHLTNDAIQKYDTSYGKYQQGNKLTFPQMQKFLNSNGKQQGWKSIYDNMRSMAKRVVESSYAFLDPQRRQNFELFGLDFMVDENLETYLIETNYNPCLETSCPILMRIIPHLMENIFQMTIDCQYPPPSQYPLTEKHNLCKSPLEYNNFQLVFDETNNIRESQFVCENELSKQVLLNI